MPLQKKICDEKYIGKKIKCCVSGGQVFIRSYHHYEPDSDSLWYSVENNGLHYCVYTAGKFAEIVPGKKKLPMTKNEFKEFLFDAFKYKKGKRYLMEDGWIAHEFLKDYED